MYQNYSICVCGNSSVLKKRKRKLNLEEIRRMKIK